MHWRSMAILTTTVSLLTAGLVPAADPTPKITADVVYGHKDGLALTFDVFQPGNPNGAGVLWIQSSGWYSIWVEPKTMLPGLGHLLEKGYTVFVVRHGSAPRYTVPDAVDDVRRAVRYIRLHAKDWGVDPERLGVTGASAGGHLTLMLASTGDDGNPKAADPVLRGSSKIAAGVALCPPTDLRGWVNTPPDAIKAVPGLKPPLTFAVEKEAAVSPVTFAGEKTAPVLMIHGDKDTLVPIEHSKNMLTALKKAGASCELLTIEGAGHGLPHTKVRPALLEWFDKHLAKKP